MAAGNQTTNLNTISLPEFTDLVRRNWVATRQNIIRNAKQLFISENIGGGNGSSKRFKEVDIETYSDVKPEGANNTKAKVGVGYEVDMTARSFSKEIDITIEMRNDNREKEVGTYIRNLNEFCDNRMDLDLTHRFTFAGSTNYTDKNGYTVDLTVGDGLALVSSVHTLAFASATYSNLVSGAPAFSQSAFEAAKSLAVTQIFSNFGEKRVINFNTIVSGDDPSTVRAIKQFLNSTADVDAIQSGLMNVYNGAMKHVVLPNLATTAAGAPDSTKKRYWFVVASGQGVNGWQAYVGTWIAPKLTTPAAGNNGEDIHNGNWTYSTFTRYGIAVVSPKGLIGSLVVS
jgi:hypothetical protein